MIKRLRPKYSIKELQEIYAVPHDHSVFPDHVLRVEKTLELAASFLTDTDLLGADLSCGDGDILRSLPLMDRIYGDFAPGYQYRGGIEHTIELIPGVDVFVLCETLEHLDDPLAVLKQIRRKAKKLLLSTPLGEVTDENPEHYWGWDSAGVGELLIEAGWWGDVYAETNPPMGYRFQIWGCI